MKDQNSPASGGCAPGPLPQLARRRYAAPHSPNLDNQDWQQPWRVFHPGLGEAHILTTWYENMYKQHRARIPYILSKHPVVK